LGETHLGEEGPAPLDLIEHPEKVANVDADVPGMSLVKAVVPGDILPHSIEVQAHESAFTVDDRRS
jgi:hypothetical protein